MSYFIQQDQDINNDNKHTIQMVNVHRTDQAREP